MNIQALAGRVGGYARAAKYDGREMTARARQTFVDSFLEGHACKVCPEVVFPADLLPVERQRRAEALRRSHYARVALSSARARADKRKSATATNGDALEVDRDFTTTPHRRAS